MPNQPILDHLWIIPLLPLLGAAVNGFFGLKWPNTIVNTVALSSTGLSFACALEAVRAAESIEQREIRAPGGEMRRERAADAASGTGNENRLATNIH